MGFFDFLSGSDDYGLGPKKKKLGPQQPTEVPSPMQAVNPFPTETDRIVGAVSKMGAPVGPKGVLFAPGPDGDETPKVMGPEESRDGSTSKFAPNAPFEQRRKEAVDRIVQATNTAVEDALKSSNDPSVDPFAEPPTPDYINAEKEKIAKAIAEDPESALKILKEQFGVKSKFARDVETALVDFRKMRSTPEGVEFENILNPPPNPTELAAEIKALGERKKQLQSEKAYTTGTESEKQIDRQIKNIDSSIKAKTDLIKKAPKIQKPSPGALPTPTIPSSDTAQPVTTGGSNDSNIKGAFGQDPRVLPDAMREIRDQTGIDPKTRMNFFVGLQTLLPLFPELGPAFANWGAQESAKAGPQQPAKAGQPQPQEEELPASAAMRMERNALRKELADAEEMQSFGAILAYVLLSLAIGPQLAFTFFSNAKKKGELKGQIEDINNDIEAADKMEQEERTNREWYNRQAALSSMRRTENKEDAFLRSQLRMQENWVRASEKAQTEEEKKYIAGLKAMFSRKMSLAKYYQFNMNQALANKYLEEAEDISDELDGIAAGQPESDAVTAKPQR